MIDGIVLLIVIGVAGWYYEKYKLLKEQAGNNVELKRENHGL